MKTSSQGLGVVSGAFIPRVGLVLTYLLLGLYVLLSLATPRKRRPVEPSARAPRTRPAAPVYPPPITDSI